MLLYFANTKNAHVFEYTDSRAHTSHRAKARFQHVRLGARVLITTVYIFRTVYVAADGRHSFGRNTIAALEFNLLCCCVYFVFQFRTSVYLLACYSVH